MMNNSSSDRNEHNVNALLMQAVRNADNKRIPGLLKESGINLATQDSSGNTVLHLAMNSGVTAHNIEKILLMRADVNAQNALGETALHLAVRGRKTECATITTLLAHGAQLGIQNKAGLTPLHILVEKDCPPLLWSLFDKYPVTVNFVDQQGNTPLMMMLKKNPYSWSYERMLNYQNLNVTHTNLRGETVLSLIRPSNMHTTLAKALIKRGADIHTVTHEGEGMLLHFLQNNQRNESEFISELMSAGYKLRLRDMLTAVRLHEEQVHSEKNSTSNYRSGINYYGTAMLEAIVGTNVNKPLLVSLANQYYQNQNKVQLLHDLIRLGVPLSPDHENGPLRMAYHAAYPLQNEIPISEADDAMQMNDALPKIAPPVYYPESYGVFAGLLDFHPDIDMSPKIVSKPLLFSEAISDLDFSNELNYQAKKFAKIT